MSHSDLEGSAPICGYFFESKGHFTKRLVIRNKACNYDAIFCPEFFAIKINKVIFGSDFITRMGCTRHWNRCIEHMRTEEPLYSPFMILGEANRGEPINPKPETLQKEEGCCF